MYGLITPLIFALSAVAKMAVVARYRIVCLVYMIASNGILNFHERG